MDWPKELLDMCQESAAEFRDDIEGATDNAVRRFNDSVLSCNREIHTALVRFALRELIYQYRHRSNSELKAGVQTNRPGTLPRPIVGVSTGATRTVAVFRLLTDYTICGIVLGEMTGEDLRNCKATELKMSEGHLDNYFLCDMLEPQVGEGQKVKNVFTNEEAGRIFDRAQKAAERKLRMKKPAVA